MHPGDLSRDGGRVDGAVRHEAGAAKVFEGGFLWLRT